MEHGKYKGVVGKAGKMAAAMGEKAMMKKKAGKRVKKKAGKPDMGALRSFTGY